MCTDATLAILAGGAGRRLGGATKALLEVEGRTIVERQRAVLAPLFARVVLVAPDPAPFRGLGVEVVGDRFPGRGAPGGVHAALAAATTPWVFAIAGDMPFPSAPAVALLAERRGDAAAAGSSSAVHAVVPLRGGYLEPLFAFYAVAACRPPLERALASGGSMSLVALLESVGACRVPEESLRGVDPDLRCLENVNTPEDLARARGTTR